MKKNCFSSISNHISPSASCVAPSLYSLRDFHLFYILPYKFHFIPFCASLNMMNQELTSLSLMDQELTSLNLVNQELASLNLINDELTSLNLMSQELTN
jgi:hypothetical protein